MAFGSGKSISSGVFRYQYQQTAINILSFEFLAIAAISGFLMQSFGGGLLVLLGLFIMLFIPYLRMILVIAISIVYVVIAFGIAFAFSSGNGIDLSSLDLVGIGLVAFLFSMGIHMFALDFARDAAETDSTTTPRGGD